MSTVNSTHEPRNGMMRDEISRWPFGCVALLEHDAGRPVELADDDALGAVDDEGAERREQRQLTEIDLLLDDVARALDAVDFLVDDELQRRLERRRVRHVALDALLDGVLRLAEGVADELQREVLVDVGDREQVLEDPLEADVLAVVRGGIQLEQRLEGARLDVEEMGHLHPLVVELTEGNLLSSIQACLTREQAKTAVAPEPLARNARGPGRAVETTTVVVPCNESDARRRRGEGQGCTSDRGGGGVG